MEKVTSDIESAVVDPDQVAGHGKMLRNNVTLYKPKNPVEHEFYLSVNRRLPSLLPFVPTFHGTAKPEESPVEYIALGNVTANFVSPCILDLKIGKKQHLKTFSHRKIATCVDKCLRSTSSKVGYRICGMKVYRAQVEKFDSFGKEWGRQLTLDSLYLALRDFFNPNDITGAEALPLRYDVVKFFLLKLQQLLQIMTKQEEYKFISSSVLFVYDGGRTDEVMGDVRLIDFANTFPREEKRKLDKGCIYGLENMIAYFERILADQ